MSHHDDGMDDIPQDQLPGELSRQMRTYGSLVAFRTSVEICEDQKAPAGARATSASNLLRVGGYFAVQDANAGGEKGLGEMSAAELRAASQKAKAELAALDRRRNSEPLRQPEIDLKKKKKGSIFD